MGVIMKTYIITRSHYSKKGTLCGRVDLAYSEEEARELYTRLEKTLNPRGFTCITLDSSSGRKPLKSRKLHNHKAPERTFRRVIGE